MVITMVEENSVIKENKTEYVFSTVLIHKQEVFNVMSNRTEYLI